MSPSHTIHFHLTSHLVTKPSDADSSIPEWIGQQDSPLHTPLSRFWLTANTRGVVESERWCVTKLAPNTVLDLVQVRVSGLARIGADFHHAVVDCPLVLPFPVFTVTVAERERRSLAVPNGRRVLVPIVSGEDGIEALRVILGIYKSSSTGKKIRISEKK